EREQQQQKQGRTDAVAAPRPERAAEEQDCEYGCQGWNRDPEDVDRLPRCERETGEDQCDSCVEHRLVPFEVGLHSAGCASRAAAGLGRLINRIDVTMIQSHQTKKGKKKNPNSCTTPARIPTCA